MVAFQRATEMPEAEAAQERARSVLEQARRSLPGDDPALLAMLSNLASIYCWLGKIDRAAPLSAEILALARQRGSRADLTVAAALAQQALVYKNQAGDLDTAADLYRQALEIHRRLTGELHPDVANTHNQLGLIAREQGDLAEAVTQHTTALDIRRRLYPEGDHWEIAQSHGHLGAVRRDQGEFAAAIEHLRQAHLMYLEHPDRGVEHTRTGEYLIQVGEVFLLWGDPQAAERTVRREIPTAWWDARPENSRMVAWANGVLGQALALQGREAEARPLLEGAAKALAEKPQGYERENRQVQTWYAALDF
jgi:tetratricopeptide (TPR) repeat protein